MTSLKIFKLLLILICFTCTNVLFAQNDILFVNCRMDPSKPDITKISDEIAAKIHDKIKLVTRKMGPLNYYANTVTSNTENYDLINSSKIKYILHLDNIIKTGSLYELNFSFSSVDIAKQVKGKKISEVPIKWDNAIYIVTKELNNTFSNIDDILTDISEEINFYLKYGNFRPRIYIDQKLFGPDEASSIIQFNNFCNWLDKTLQNASDENKINYVIYYKNKKIYSDKASARLYGEFETIQNDDSRMNVILKIKTDANDFKRQPVKIYIDDFNTGKYTNEQDYKQKVITYIYELCASSNN